MFDWFLTPTPPQEIRYIVRKLAHNTPGTKPTKGAGGKGKPSSSKSSHTSKNFQGQNNGPKKKYGGKGKKFPPKGGKKFFPKNKRSDDKEAQDSS